jgi:predicted metal-dependent HD superfamily phosphohydrolase
VSINSIAEPLEQDALERSWSDAWSTLQRPAPAGLRDELLAAWGEANRHYHDLRHLGECVGHFERWRDACERPGEVALALWFHDAIYNTKLPGNELRSASWAARALVRAGVASEIAQRVYDLVMATRHDKPAVGRDAELLVDIDLAILGSPPERFQAYELDVRHEYSWVPTARYQTGRLRILKGFLERPQIYHFEPAVKLLEAQARSNLMAAISRLEQ